MLLSFSFPRKNVPAAELEEGIVLLAHLLVPAGEEEGEGHWVPAGREEVAVDQVERAQQVACSQLQLAELAEDDLMKVIRKSQFAKNSKEASTITIMICQERGNQHVHNSIRYVYMYSLAAKAAVAPSATPAPTPSATPPG